MYWGGDTMNGHQSFFAFNSIDSIQFWEGDWLCNNSYPELAGNPHTVKVVVSGANTESPKSALFIDNKAYPLTSLTYSNVACFTYSHRRTFVNNYVSFLNRHASPQISTSDIDDFQINTPELDSATSTYTVEWNNDTDSGISTNKIYTHVVNLYGNDVTVNGVTFVGSTNAGSNFELYTASPGTHPLPAARSGILVTGNAANLLSEMYANGTSEGLALTLTGLTPNQEYILSLYAMASARGIRESNIAASDGAVISVVNQDQRAEGNGIILKQRFVAEDDGSFTVSATPIDGTWQWFAFSNEIYDEPGIVGNPEFVSVEWTDYPTPPETRNVTVTANIAAENSTISNAVLFYKLNNGVYQGPYQMSPQNIDEFTYSIPSQTVGTDVDFYMIADNIESMVTTSTVYQYKIYEDLDWTSVVVTEHNYLSFPNVPSMALSSDGNAGIILRAPGYPVYVEESSLGYFGSFIGITTDSQGYMSDIVYDSLGEPNAVISYDITGGDSFIKRTSSVWDAPELIITNNLDERRAVIAIAPDDDVTVLWFDSPEKAIGELIEIDSNGNVNTVYEISTNNLPIVPNKMRRSFGLVIGNDYKKRIVLSGQSNDINQIWFGTEQNAGSQIFDWELIALSNAIADQIGFAIDDNNFVYISCRENDNCCVFENSNTNWLKHTLGDAPYWNRSAVAIDPRGYAWVAHNSSEYNHFYLWSNRSGIFKEEQVIINDVPIETIAGFEFAPNGAMKLAYSPDVFSSDVIYMYNTTFVVPEPTLFLIFNFGFLIFLTKKYL